MNKAQKEIAALTTLCYFSSPSKCVERMAFILGISSNSIAHTLSKNGQVGSNMEASILECSRFWKQAIKDGINPAIEHDDVLVPIRKARRVFKDLYNLRKYDIEELVKKCSLNSEDSLKRIVAGKTKSVQGTSYFKAVTLCADLRDIPPEKIIDNTILSILYEKPSKYLADIFAASRKQNSQKQIIIYTRDQLKRKVKGKSKLFDQLWAQYGSPNYIYRLYVFEQMYKLLNPEKGKGRVQKGQISEDDLEASLSASYPRIRCG